MLKIAWSSIYAHPLPENHRFPMEKYELLPEQLIYEGTVAEGNFFSPQKVNEKQILAVHDSNYLGKLQRLELSKAEIRKTGFPLSLQLIEREVHIMHGSLQAALYALQYGIAMNIAGGTHHAYADRGEGFCLLNDIAIAAQYLLDEKLVKKVLVIDLDVHQGNGTAAIFHGQNNVFTFSMHGADNYPLRKEHSDLDIPLGKGTDDATYLRILTATLPKLMEKVQPDFVIYQSGVDVLSTDKLGKLGLTIGGCKERDRQVLSCCYKNNIPVMACMGGGYSQRIAHIVEAHANTFRLAQEIFF